MNNINLKLEKLVFGGQALGYYNDKAVFCWNALPCEEVEAEIVKKKKGLLQAVATKIIKPSTERIEPKESHFLSCSPWQILDFEKENFYKKQISQEVFEKIGKFKVPKDFDIVSVADFDYEYRNKMEYSLWHDDNQHIDLAFFERGKHYRYAIKPCLLAQKQINVTAQTILDWLNEKKVPRGMLKTVILRSNNQNQSIAALFIKEDFKFKTYPKLNNNFLGLQIYLSNPKSPASVPDKLLYSQGQDFLITKINDVELKFGLLSFFQIHVPVFEKALQDIAKFLDPDKSVVDYYSGVGAIGLSLNKYFKDCVLVDNVAEAIDYAQQNIELNKIKNCEAKLCEAEKITDLIEPNKIIIFDPPRAGLHKNVVQRVLEQKPERIIYLSCNLSTQARDIEVLKDYYKIEFLKLYNFFPKTPHVEALCVLDRIKDKN